MGKLGEETAIEREVQERKDEAAALSGRLDEETQRSSANLEEESKTLKSLAGTVCIEKGLPGKLILIKRKGLWEIIFS